MDGKLAVRENIDRKSSAAIHFRAENGDLIDDMKEFLCTCFKGISSLNEGPGLFLML